MNKHFFSNLADKAVNSFEKGVGFVTDNLNEPESSINNAKERMARKCELKQVKAQYFEESVNFVSMIIKLGELPDGFTQEIVNKYSQLLKLDVDIKKLEELQAKEYGLIPCANCGEFIDKNNDYCSKCGCINIKEDTFYAYINSMDGKQPKKINILLKNNTQYKNVSLRVLNKENKSIIVEDSNRNQILIYIDDIKKII